MSDSTLHRVALMLVLTLVFSPAIACEMGKQSNNIYVHISSASLLDERKPRDYWLSEPTSVLISFPSWASIEVLGEKEKKKVVPTPPKLVIDRLPSEDRKNLEIALGPVPDYGQYRTFAAVVNFSSTIVIRSEFGLQFINFSFKDSSGILSSDPVTTSLFPDVTCRDNSETIKKFPEMEFFQRVDQILTSQLSLTSNELHSLISDNDYLIKILHDRHPAFAGFPKAERWIEVDSGFGSLQIAFLVARSENKVPLLLWKTDADDNFFLVELLGLSSKLEGMIADDSQTFYFSQNSNGDIIYQVSVLRGNRYLFKAINSNQTVFSIAGRK